MKCKWDKPWIGACSKESDNVFCDEHINKKCVSCGNQATHGCDMASSLVCGSPLCDNCDHTQYPLANFSNHASKEICMEQWEKYFNKNGRI